MTPEEEICLMARKKDYLKIYCKGYDDGVLDLVEDIERESNDGKDTITQ